MPEIRKISVEGVLYDIREQVPGAVAGHLASLDAEGRLIDSGVSPDSLTVEETDPTVPAWAKEQTKPAYTADEVGLGNVDNTGDLAKPVSTAMQTALDGKAAAADLTALSGEVDTLDGAVSALSGEVTALDGRLDTAEGDIDTLEAAVAGKAAAGDLTAHTGDTANPHAVSKAQVGLGSADNTADADKPVSTLMQAALDLKAAAADLTALSVYVTTLDGAVDVLEAALAALDAAVVKLTGAQTVAGVKTYQNTLKVMNVTNNSTTGSQANAIETSGNIMTTGKLQNGNDKTSYSAVGTSRYCTADGSRLNTSTFFTNSDGRSKFCHKLGSIDDNDDAFMVFNALGFKVAFSGTKGTKATTEYDLLHTNNGYLKTELYTKAEVDALFAALRTELGL